MGCGPTNKVHVAVPVSCTIPELNNLFTKIESLSSNLLTSKDKLNSKIEKFKLKFRGNTLDESLVNMLSKFNDCQVDFTISDSDPFVVYQETDISTEQRQISSDWQSLLKCYRKTKSNTTKYTTEIKDIVLSINKSDQHVQFLIEKHNSSAHEAYQAIKIKQMNAKRGKEATKRYRELKTTLDFVEESFGQLQISNKKIKKDVHD